MSDIKKTIKLNYQSNLNEIENRLSNMSEKVNNSVFVIKKSLEEINKKIVENQKLLSNTNMTKSVRAQFELTKKELDIQKQIAEIKLKSAKEQKQLIDDAQKNESNTKSRLSSAQTYLGALSRPGILNKVSALARIGIGKRYNERIANATDVVNSGLESAQSNYENDPRHKAWLENKAKIDAAQIKLQSIQKTKAITKAEKQKLLNQEAGVKGWITRLNKKDAQLSIGEAEALGEKGIAESGAVAKGSGLATKAGSAAAGATVAVGAALAVAKVIIDTLKKIGQLAKDTLGISFSIKDNFQSMVKSVGEMLDLRSGMATYNTSTSLITNSKARETQMRYGLSSGQTYALTRTMGLMNMSGDEDLMYMNREQVALFRTFMGKYDAWYNQLQSSGVLDNIQKTQLDLEMFKEELAVDFMQWFAANKDTLLTAIKSTAKFVMKLTEIVAKITEWINGGVGSIFGMNKSYGSGYISESMSDYVGNRGSGATVKTVNINVHQTNNASGVISDQQHLEEFFGEQMGKYAQEIALALG